MAEEEFEFDGDTYDVSAAKKLLKDKNRRVVNIATDALKRMAPTVSISKRKALRPEIDLAVPIIVAIRRGRKLPIDGWHRIYKALKNGIKTLPAQILTVEESREVLE